MTQSMSQENVEAPKPGWSGHGRILWYLAWGVIAAIIGLHFAWPAQEGAGGRGRPSPQFVMMSRYMLGAREAFSLTGSHAARDELDRSLTPGLRGYVQSAEDQMWLAVVISETQGADAAVAQLDDIQDSSLSTGTMEHDVEILRRLYEEGWESIQEHERNDLIQRHAWFGKLALSHGLTRTDPLRQEVMYSALKTFVLILGFVVGAFVCLLLGVALLILGIVLWSLKKLHSGYVLQADMEECGKYLELTALYLLVGMGAIKLLTHWGGARRWEGLALMLTVGALGAFFWPLARGEKWSRFRAAMGWTMGKGWWREVGAGVLGYLAGLPLLVGGAVITLILIQFTGNRPSHPITEWLSGASLRTWGSAVFLAVIFAPIVEESLFRGAFFHSLRSRAGWWVAALLPSLVFALLHPQGWETTPPLMALAVTFSALRQWRGSLIAPMTAHALNNLAVTLLLILVMN